MNLFDACQLAVIVAAALPLTAGAPQPLPVPTCIPNPDGSGCLQPPTMPCLPGASDCTVTIVGVAPDATGAYVWAQSDAKDTSPKCDSDLHTYINATAHGKGSNFCSIPFQLGIPGDKQGNYTIEGCGAPMWAVSNGASIGNCMDYTDNLTCLDDDGLAGASLKYVCGQGVPS
ncbi:hypothetical protein C8R44DRAFT_992560 [Mycena epipterygia]|nr:hypothetical protein C8R44DRAFT_992560 [Mycena epipterygia]